MNARQEYITHKKLKKLEAQNNDYRKGLKWLIILSSFEALVILYMIMPK